MIRKTVLALIVLTFRPALPMALAIDPDQESRDNRDLLRDSKSSKRTEPLNALLHLEARAGVHYRGGIASSRCILSRTWRGNSSSARK